MGTRKQPLIHLREWRQVRGLTQRQLSQRSGVPSAEISKLENHMYGPMPRRRQRLAQALGIESDQLLAPPPANADWDRRRWIRRAMALEDGTRIQHAVVFSSGDGFGVSLTVSPEAAERLAQDLQQRGQKAWPVVLEGSGGPIEGPERSGSPDPFAPPYVFDDSVHP